MPITDVNIKILFRGIQPFGVSGPHWKKKSCLGLHIKYIVTHNTRKSHNVLSKFTIVCWTVFIAIPGGNLNLKFRLSSIVEIYLTGNWKFISKAESLGLNLLLGK